MKNICIQFSFFLLIMLSSCSEEKITGEDFGVIEGKVVSAVTFEPMENVKVFSNPNSSIVFTDVEGKFTIPSVKVGQYSVEAQKENYITKFESATVNVNGTTTIVFELKLSTTNNKPPLSPVLVAPTDNALNQNLDQNLSWTGSDPEDDILTYEITLRNDTNSDVVVYSNIAESNFSLSELKYSTKYYWQVSASDGVSPAVLSVVYSFTTTSFPNDRYLFVKKANDNNVIYSGNDAGEQLQLTNSNTNSWRPRKNTQANKIAFIRASGSQNHIYTMNPDGSGIFKVTNAVPIAGFNSEFINFSWSADGSQIIYPFFDKLYRINSNGTGLTEIFKTPDGKFISECDWSFDNTKIALKVNDASGYKAEIYVINTSGVITNRVVSGIKGALGGLNFSVTGQKIIFTDDKSGFEDPSYRQLDTRVYEHDFLTGLTLEIGLEKPAGSLDLDVRYSPSEAALILTNTSNDGLSVKNIVVFKPSNSGEDASRVIIFPNASMPDWE
ncbi:carboxypeptidase regulatory-like domain-containing protein [Flavobacterium sp. W22_SRS_FP1]|uniref:carboxypeptidase regulatory-like domain-containing protein n=1 Tax=Flavobacterium sp. W22_SRS_FP1 TaxID=3240276 RepID=UPI003F8FA2B0